MSQQSIYVVTEFGLGFEGFFSRKYILCRDLVWPGQEFSVAIEDF